MSQFQLNLDASQTCTHEQMFYFYSALHGSSHSGIYKKLSWWKQEIWVNLNLNNSGKTGKKYVIIHLLSFHAEKSVLTSDSRWIVSFGKQYRLLMVKVSMSRAYA